MKYLCETTALKINPRHGHSFSKDRLATSNLRRCLINLADKNMKMMNASCFKHTTKQDLLRAFRLGALSNLPALNSEEMKHSLCQVSDCTFINHTTQYLLFIG